MKQPGEPHLTVEMRQAMEDGTWPDWEVGVRLLAVLESHCDDCAKNYHEYLDGLGLDDLSSPEARARAHRAVIIGLVELRRAFKRDEEAHRDLKTLKRTRVARRKALLTASPGRFRSPLLVEDLIAETDRHLRRHPARALEWLEIATEVHPPDRRERRRRTL